MTSITSMAQRRTRRNQVIFAVFDVTSKASVLITFASDVRGLQFVTAGTFGQLHEAQLKNKKLSCRREIARRFVSLNIRLSHSRPVKVIQNDTLE